MSRETTRETSDGADSEDADASLELPEPARAARPRGPQLALISFCRLRSPGGRGSSGLICGQAVHGTSPT